MTEKDSYTLEQAHLEFARKANGEVWNFLGQESRSPGEDQAMILAAQASLYHWIKAGGTPQLQRGHWLLAHVNTVLEKGPLAHFHAEQCLALTQAHPLEMEDFDQAYAFEAMARANALNGNTQEAEGFHRQAKEAGEAIKDEESKKIFMSDFTGGNWYGIAKGKGKYNVDHD